MFTHWMQKQFFLMDEAGDTGAAGGGGDADLNIDMASAVDEIGAGLGLELETPPDDGGTPKAKGSATPPADKGVPAGTKPAPSDDPAKAARERAAKATEVAAARAALKDKVPDLDKKSDDEVLALAKPAPKGAPKSWKKEMHEAWTKLPADAQEYVLQREQEVEQGFMANKELVDYGKTLREAIGPYQPLLDAQGIKDHGQAVRYLLNAHYVLSSGDEATKLGFFARLAQSYKLDPQKVQAALVAGTPTDETPAMREMRERMERIEAERRNEQNARYAAVKADAAKEVAAFATDPAHPYFDEVQGHIALLLQDPSITLDQAYEMAVYANPVTRAKELTRLQGEAEEKARKEAEEKAAAAAKARGTVIRASSSERASPDPLGTMDDTMRETYKKIQNRQE